MEQATLDPTELAALAAGSLARHAAFVGRDAFMPEAAPFFAHVLRQAAASGGVVHHHRAGRLTGCLAWWREAGDGFGGPAMHALVHHDLADPDAAAWAAETLAGRYDDLPADLLLELDAGYRGLLPALFARGYRPDSVVLGATLAHIRAATADLPDALPPDIVLRPLADARDVEAVVALQRAAYTATPEFCTGGASPHQLQAVREGLTEGLRGGAPHFVLEDAEGVAGYMGAAILDPNLYWGRAGVADVVFADRIRRRRLLPPTTRRLLAALAERAVVTILAPTAQPAVMALCARLDVRPLGWMLRRTGPFEPAHFGL